MKVAVVLAIASVAVAQLPDIKDIPQCAITCLLPAITSTGCALTDLECVCKQKDTLQKGAMSCLESSCKPEELQKAQSAADAVCGGQSGSGSSSAAGSSTEAPASSTAAVTSGASSQPATTTGASSSASSVASSVSSIISTAIGHNSTATTSHSGASSTTSNVAVGTNGAAGPVAGVLAAMGAAVLAL